MAHAVLGRDEASWRLDHLCEHRLNSRQVVRIDEGRPDLADDLVALIAEQASRARAGVDEAAGGVKQQNGVGTLLDQGPKAPFVGCQRCLGPLALPSPLRLAQLARNSRPEPRPVALDNKVVRTGLEYAYRHGLVDRARDDDER